MEKKTFSNIRNQLQIYMLDINPAGINLVSLLAICTCIVCTHWLLAINLSASCENIPYYMLQ